METAVAFMRCAFSASRSAKDGTTQGICFRKIERLEFQGARRNLMTEKSSVSSKKSKALKDSALVSDVSETGLTDDERVVREDEFLGDEPRVEPGPADLERLKD
jgi:hypothetical protein